MWTVHAYRFVIQKYSESSCYQALGRSVICFHISINTLATVLPTRFNLIWIEMAELKTIISSLLIATDADRQAELLPPKAVLPSLTKRASLEG